MAFAVDIKRFAGAVLAVVSTGALVWFGNGLDPWWPLLWFAPLPVLLFALRNSGWAAGMVAFFGWLLGSLSMWHYFKVLGAPPVVWITAYSVAALLFTAGVLLFRALLRRGAVWSALVALPAVWVCGEYVSNLMTPHGTAGSLAYSQLRFLPFLQLASVTGPWGMSFVLLLFSSALAIGLYLYKSTPRQALKIVGAGVGVVALVLIFGAVRLAQSSFRQQIKVGLIASDLTGNTDVAGAGTKTERLLRDYAGEAEKLATAGAQVIVLPEKLGVVVDPNTKSADGIFQPLADKTGTTIVVGVVRASAPLKYNEARVYAPEAAMLTYEKHHMLPPFESELKPGTTLTVLPKPRESWGIGICKDMDFTPLSRQNGAAGVGLMLVPAWDFNLDRSWHGHMAVMRGVESGFSVVRAAKKGYLTVSDDRGRILAETRSSSAPFATLLAAVPTVHDRTFYLLAGDWFPWLAFGIVVFAMVQLYWLRRT